MDVDSRQKNADDCDAGEVLKAREQASFLIYTPLGNKLAYAEGFPARHSQIILATPSCLGSRVMVGSSPTRKMTRAPNGDLVNWQPSNDFGSQSAIRLRRYMMINS